MKIIKRLFLATGLLLLLSELVARFYLGLGALPVYIEDPDYEYIYAPSQNVKRFGNSIRTNAFSMRSDEVDTSAIKILGFGDSVINGGSQTDQDSLATTILSKELSKDLGRKVQLLNISANSWGPDNAYAYLKKHGDFGAKAIVLFVSSHDLHDLRHFKKVVGVHPAWPGNQPMCAISDGIFKYALPMLRAKFDSDYNPYSYLGINTNSKMIDPGFDDFISYCTHRNIPLLVYIHPTSAEAKAGSYDANGRKIQSMMDSAKVSYLSPLKEFNQKLLYRDFIHLNPSGQRQMANLLRPQLKKLLR